MTQRSSLILLAVAMMLAPRILQAETLTLNGPWEFAVDSTRMFSAGSVGSSAHWRTALVPLSWQAQFADLRDYQGVAWYRTTVSLSPIKRHETVLIQFDAVDYIAEVFVNGSRVGSHEGGYTPFEFDIRNVARTGRNEVLVRVMDPEATKQGTEGISYWNIPHGKQSWYVQTSGIWRGARVLVVPSRRASSMQVTATTDGNVKIHGVLSGATKGKASLRATITLLDPEGNPVAKQTRRVPATASAVEFDLHVSTPQLWSPEKPRLYTASLALGNLPPFRDRFGFRSIETRDGQILLNGEPLYIMAALDQDFYPETIYTTPSEEYLRDEMIKARELGLNMLRCHIKVPDTRYLKVADELGLLVWYEIPNWDVFSPESARRGEATLDAMLARDWNHPSLVIMSIINESWGIDMQKADQRAWLKSAFDRTKKKAVGRLVVDNSACYGNFHVKTDLNDYHTYWAIPENRAKFDQAAADVASRPSWLFSTFGDASPTGKEPLLMSEFGNWGLPKLPSTLPWWFSRKFGDIEVSLPAGYDQRFREFGYDKTFGTYDRLAEESQRAQFDALKYEIESLRLRTPIRGYVITEFTDINWESNGLLDMWRNVKVYGHELSSLQQQDVIIPRTERYSYWPGDSITVRCWVSRYSARSMDSATLEWSASTGERGSIGVGSVARGEVLEIPPLRILAQPVDRQQRVRLSLSLKGADGKLLATNFIDVSVVKRPDPAKLPHITMHDPRHALAQLQTALPVQMETNGDSATSLVITNVLDEKTLAILHEGRNVLCLVDTNTRFPAGFPLGLVSRQSEWYDGNWATNFNWVRTEREPFKEFNSRPRLGFEAANISPENVLTGLPAEHFDDALAGMFVGWIHKNSAYVVQMRVARGKLLLCTLGLAKNPANDPYGIALFHELARYVESDACTPRMEWNP